MARDNYDQPKKGAAAKDQPKADCWLNISYLNTAGDKPKRSDLGGIPITASKSVFHASLIEKLQSLDEEARVNFVAKILAQHIVVSVVFPEVAEAGAQTDFGFDAI